MQELFTPSPLCRTPMSATASIPVPNAADERVRPINPWRSFLNRPEFGSMAGTLLVFALFGFLARGSGMFNLDGVMNWLQVTAYLGVIAVSACVLMIGGEFDLSMG